jgi:hypothetical protein
MNEPSASPAGQVVKLFGALLMAVGGLITVLCGLCSLVFLATAVQGIVQHPGAPLDVQGVGGFLLLVLIFGGIPILIGVGVFIAGRRFYRGR